MTQHRQQPITTSPTRHGNVRQRRTDLRCARTVLLGCLLLVGLLALSGCGGGMSDDEKEIAVAVALTQTAAAEPAAPATPPATPTAASAAENAADGNTLEENAAAAPTTEAAANEPSPPAESAPQESAAAPTATVAEVVAAAAPAPTLAADNLPLTQNSLKVRTLLVAPGEPGPLYALLTDEADDWAPATNARFLVSRDFGQSWSAAPSGLPVTENCLYNINMDYYASTALFASTCQGIYRWSEASGEWSPIADQETRTIAVVYGNDNLIWATRPAEEDEAPLLLSQNGGQSWQEIAMTHTTGIAALGISPRDAQSGYAVLWPTGEGSNLRRGSIVQEWRVMPAPNGGATPVNPGMTINGGTGWLYVTTAETDGDRLWLSSDPDTPVLEDVNWQEVYRFAPGMNVTLLASGWSSEEDKLAIYANVTTSVDGQPRYTLVRSLDNGETWQPLVVDAG